MNKFGSCEIRKKSLKTGCWRSPRWDYKQIKVGNLIFGHAKKFSFEDNKLIGGPAKYMPVLSSNTFDTISTDELNGYIVVLKESIKVREEGTRIKYRELVNKAVSGDQEAIEQLKQIISVNYLHELTADEIASEVN